jgi:RNA polymerase sigma-70 factor (ECF subfamily)
MADQTEKSRFLELVEENQDIIHKTCRLYAANRADREDLAQEIVCQLWKSYRTFRGDSRFSTWMYKIAINTALLTLRRNHPRDRARSLRESHACATADTEDHEREDAIFRLYAAISQLRELDRAIILLHLEQLSYEEIGAVIGISEVNVSVRLVRIKRTLKKLLRRGF